MTTISVGAVWARCSVCRLSVRLTVGGLVRVHQNTRQRDDVTCPGSGLRPLQVMA